MPDAIFKKQLWVSFGIIAGSAVIAGVLIFILSARAGRIAASIIATRNALAEQSAETGVLASLKADAQTATNYEDAMGKLLPTADSVISFSDQVRQLAQQNGVAVSFAFQGNTVPAAGLTPGYIGFTLNASGPLAGLRAFWEAVEVRAPIFLSKFETLDLSQGGSGYTLAVAGKVFFQ
ncbi:MAG: hypothetical protein KGJ13_05535 [Patescibacteria group bacterium]|nr:hypothetical protein [Patescibacteria group bacterium]